MFNKYVSLDIKNIRPSIGIVFIAGYYMYTEASLRQENDTALLLSPVLFTGSSTYVSGCVKFWFHMWGNHMGTFRVKVNGKTLWQRSGDQGNRWIPATVSFRAKNSYQVFNMFFFL